MQIPNSVELCRIINTCKDAVDKSAFGPVYLEPDAMNLKQKRIDVVPYGVFTVLLTAMLRDLKNEGNKDSGTPAKIQP